MSATSIDRRGATALLRRAPASTWLFPLVAYTVTRAYDAALFLVLGRSQMALPYSVDGYHLVRPLPADPGYWTVMTAWDGQWFQDAAENGYPAMLPTDQDGSVLPNTWAFYPLYPVSVRAISAVVQLPFAVVAPILSTLLGGVAVLLLYRMLLRSTDVSTARATTLSLCCFAAAPMLQVAYPDAMTLLLVLVSLRLVHAQRFLFAAIALSLAALTRPVGVPLGMTLLLLGGLSVWRARRHGRTTGLPGRQLLLLGVWGLLSAGIWPAMAMVVTGRPSAYFDTMRAWDGYAAITVGTGWFKALADNPVPLIGGVVLLVLVVSCLLIVVRPGARAWGPELRAWVGVYADYLIVATGRPALGTLRHLLLAPVVGWPLPHWSASSSAATAKRRTALLLVLCAGGLFCQYLWISQIMTFHTWPTHQPGPP